MEPKNTSQISQHDLALSETRDLALKYSSDDAVYRKLVRSFNLSRIRLEAPYPNPSTELYINRTLFLVPGMKSIAKVGCDLLMSSLYVVMGNDVQSAANRIFDSLTFQRPPLGD